MSLALGVTIGFKHVAWQMEEDMGHGQCARTWRVPKGPCEGFIRSKKMEKMNAF